MAPRVVACGGPQPRQLSISPGWGVDQGEGKVSEADGPAREWRQ